MKKIDLQGLAQIAAREGSTVRILDNPIQCDSISVSKAPWQISQDTSKVVEKIADENWKLICNPELFNGVICAVQSIYTSGGSVSIEVVEIDYKTFRATDLVIERIEGFFPPLAVGVHALLLGQQSILSLKMADGTFGTPGGAVDAGDLAGPAPPFVNALLREINEETGIQIEQDSIKLCEACIVHNPLHLVFIYVALVEEDIILSADFNRSLDEEKIVGLKSIDLRDISSLNNSINDALSLCISSAKRLGYI